LTQKSEMWRQVGCQDSAFTTASEREKEIERERERESERERKREREKERERERMPGKTDVTIIKTWSLLTKYFTLHV